MTIFHQLLISPYHRLLLFINVLCFFYTSIHIRTYFSNIDWSIFNLLSPISYYHFYSFSIHFCCSFLTCYFGVCCSVFIYFILSHLYLFAIIFSLCFVHSFIIPIPLSLVIFVFFIYLIHHK